MDYPTKSPLPKPCPNCGGALSRQTVDPAKPLEVVKCAGCAYTSPIADFAASMKTAAKAAAQARKAQG